MSISFTSAAGYKALGSGTLSRAYADVYIRDAAGTTKSPTFNCLVDTGSDHTILPMAAAHAIGLIPSGPNATFVSVGGGRYTLPSHSPVELVVEGYVIHTTVAFSTSSSFPLVIGRIQLIEAFSIGLDDANWYWD